MVESMLTTIDNPYDPFTQFKQWHAWDMHSGYNTLSLLARLAQTSSELSETDQDLAIQRAMEEVVEENVSGVHRMATREVPDN